MNILDALRDPQLFAALPAFRDLATWRPWQVFKAAVYGLVDELAVLDPDRAIFRAHTGRQEPRPGGYPETVCIVGCQSGKSQVAALVGVYEALQAVKAGRRGLHVPLIAQDLRGAQRALLSYVREAVEASAILRAAVVRETADTLELAGGVSLGVYPCRPASVRGIRAACVVVDELAFFISTEGRPTDVEMLRAIRSRVATTGGKVLILSSPYAQAGALWDLHRKHYGREDSPVLVWQATAPQMNPTLPADYLTRMEAEDPEAYRSEVLGEFRTGLTTLFDPEALDAVVVSGRRELAPVRGIAYSAFVDPSGGRADAFTLAVAHRVDKRAVVDAMRAWPAPFDPSRVVAEAAAFLKLYGLWRVTGDRYGGEWPREAFRKHGIQYDLAELDRSGLYVAMLPKVNAGECELLDLPDLLRELRGLERRRGPSGRDRVDHRPGAHDDRANAVAGALSLVAAARGVVSNRTVLWG